MSNIQARLVLEILGRPPENVTQALTALIEKMGKEKGVKIIEKQLHEPVPVEDSKDLYTTFAEVTVEMESVANFFGIIFVYLPSHIEIISPERIELSNYDLNGLGNALTQRMHQYDAITKKILVERDFLTAKLKEFAPHLFKKKEGNTEETKVKEKKAKKEKKSKKN